jgi:hypothetical protein
MLAVIPSAPVDAFLATDTAMRSMPARPWVGPLDLRVRLVGLDLDYQFEFVVGSHETTF